MKDYETILHHEIIRNTVGYDFISDLDLFDLPAVINFLEITLDYSKLDNISVGTVDYTDGEDRRPNLLKGHSSVKSEAHESLVRG